MINLVPWQTGWPTAAEILLAASIAFGTLIFLMPGRAKAQGFLSYPELNTTTLASELYRDEFTTNPNNQPRLSDEATGIRAGSLFFYPSATATTTFDDNIFGTGVNPESDLKTVFTPRLEIKSDFPRHALDLSLSGRIVTFAEHSDQNYQDYRATASGALHFDHAHTISAGLITELAHEEVGDILAPLNASEPVPVFHHRASAAITRDVGRLYGTLSTHIERWDYQDVTANDGTRLDQDNRDLDTVGGRLEAGYRISPGFSVLASTGITHYMHAGRPGADLDGTRYDILAGVGFETSPLLKFRLLGGAGLRDYDDPNFETATTSVFAGNVTWLPTQRMQLTADISRSIEDTIDEDAGTRISTTAAASINYEIYHNLVGTAGVSFTNSDFNLTDRTDDLWSASLGLEYNYSRNMKFMAGYQFVHRDSSIDLYDADRNRFTIGGKLQF